MQCVFFLVTVLVRVHADAVGRNINCVSVVLGHDDCQLAFNAPIAGWRNECVLGVRCGVRGNEVPLAAGCWRMRHSNKWQCKRIVHFGGKQQRYTKESDDLFYYNFPMFFL